MYLSTLPVDVITMLVPPESDAISMVNVTDALPVVADFVHDRLALSCVQVEASFEVNVPVVGEYLIQ